MKIKLLISEKINKTYNVLNFVKKDQNIASSTNLVEFYNEENWFSIFNKTYQNWKEKQFDYLIVLDDYGFLPFMFFSKQKSLVGTLAFDQESAKLIREHNNSMNCIIPVKKINMD